MNKIKIGCLTYKVIDWDKDDSDEASLYGTHSSKTQRIKLASDMSVERKKEVLLHEVIHAIWDQWMVHEEGFKEEEVVRALAIGLTTVFKDNPDLKKELF